MKKALLALFFVIFVLSANNGNKVESKNSIPTATPTNKPVIVFDYKDMPISTEESKPTIVSTPVVENTPIPTITPTIEPIITEMPIIIFTETPTEAPVISEMICTKEPESKKEEIVGGEAEATKKPEITSMLYNIETGETLPNGTGYFIGKMGNLDIYLTSKTYSCYFDNDIDFLDVDLSYMKQVDQKEWNKYSYEMKLVYLNQLKIL